METEDKVRDINRIAIRNQMIDMIEAQISEITGPLERQDRYSRNFHNVYPQWLSENIKFSLSPSKTEKRNGEKVRSFSRLFVHYRYDDVFGTRLWITSDFDQGFARVKNLKSGIKYVESLIADSLFSDEEEGY
jgi:hypothetical protein